MKRGIARAAAGTVIGVAAVVATATPAAAASSQCFVGSSGNCTTSALHAQYGTVDIIVNNIGRWKSCPWRIRDINTGVVVRSGTAAANTRIYNIVGGLSGYYQGELRGCLVSATGILSNNF